jgi:hypothetical protein
MYHFHGWQRRQFAPTRRCRQRWRIRRRANVAATRRAAIQPAPFVPEDVRTRHEHPPFSSESPPRSTRGPASPPLPVAVTLPVLDAPPFPPGSAPPVPTFPAWPPDVEVVVLPVLPDCPPLPVAPPPLLPPLPPRPPAAPASRPAEPPAPTEPPAPPVPPGPASPTGGRSPGFPQPGPLLDWQCVRVCIQAHAPAPYSLSGPQQ